MRSDILTKDLLDLKDRINKLTNEQRDILLDLIDPQPEPQVAQKQAVKKRKPRTGTKSPRAASLAEQIKATSKARDSDSDPNTHCQKTFPGGFVCDEPADANVHHLRGGTGYHEFVVGESRALSAGALASNPATSSAVNGEIKLDYVSHAGPGEEI